MEKKKYLHHLWLMNAGMFKDVAQWAETMGRAKWQAVLLEGLLQSVLALMSKERTQCLELCGQ